MQLRRCAFALFSALLLPIAAHADTTDTFAIGGTGYTLDFSIPSSFPVSAMSGGEYTIHNVDITLNGVATTANVSFLDNEDFLVTIGSSDFLSYSFFAPFDTSTSTTVDFTSGVYLGEGFVNCDASLKMPGQSLLPTLALWHAPVLSTTCGDPTSMFILPGSTPVATPEPAPLALLGTGLLGLFGILRRKLIA